MRYRLVGLFEIVLPYKYTSPDTLPPPSILFLFRSA